ncbi:MAG: hypothetical protein H0T70_02075, partial [Acidimicrobiia bacterium]|nr:hypothetical protein [Acidimicrobiia bacterium]
SEGPHRLLLPVVAAGLGVRTLLAWVQRAQRGLPHAVETKGASGHCNLVR